MGQPTWREIKKLMVPEREAGLWTPALDYVSTGKLYLILVETQVDAAPAQPQPAEAAAAAPPADAANPAPDAADAAAHADAAAAQAGADPAADAAAAQAVAGAAAAADGGAAAPVAAEADGAPPPPAAANAAEHPPAGFVEPAVPRDQQWTPEAGTPCTADGDPSLERKDGGLVIETCAAGALIAKIGGSTADIKPDTNKTTLFGVGRHCVFTITDATKTGSLYLGINDTNGSIRRLQGQLEVTIFEAL